MGRSGSPGHDPEKLQTFRMRSCPKSNGAPDAARDEMARFEAQAEKAYDAMYDSRNPAACYADLKDFFAAAIGAAKRAGLHQDADRLTKRLDHCRQIYRKQFSHF